MYRSLSQVKPSSIVQKISLENSNNKALLEHEHRLTKVETEIESKETK